MGYYSIFFILTLISFFSIYLKDFKKLFFLNILTFVLLSTFVGLGMSWWRLESVRKLIPAI